MSYGKYYQVVASSRHEWLIPFDRPSKKTNHHVEQLVAVGEMSVVHSEVFTQSVAKRRVDPYNYHGAGNSGVLALKPCTGTSQFASGEVGWVNPGCSVPVRPSSSIPVEGNMGRAGATSSHQLGTTIDSLAIHGIGARRWAWYAHCLTTPRRFIFQVWKKI